MSLSSRRDLAALSAAAAVAGVTLAGCAVEAQVPFPNLTDAEAHLAAALEALHRAPDRFGGHKAEAIRLIRGALSEIEMARLAFR